MDWFLGLLGGPALRRNHGLAIVKASEPVKGYLPRAP